jgi:predicted nucleotidyltransferase
MGKVLETRRNNTRTRFQELQKQLNTAAKTAANRVCVYATGSFGRGEASDYSDLDLFIVGLGQKNSRKLSRLQEICLEAELILATQRLRIPEFSGDGEYLVHYTQHELVEALGKRHDDANNTFAARLLLLLESKPVLGQRVYEQTIDSVIAKYWRDYADHEDDFIPAFLGNDILRLWRTFCVNYEASTSSEPEEKRAKRKLKNYKLRHSRLLTCYSALLYLLATYVSQHTVHSADAIGMTRLSPTERLEWLLRREYVTPKARKTVSELINCYESFLDATDRPESQLIEIFLDSERSKEYSHSASRLGDLTFEALKSIGRESRFYRVLVV